MEREAGPTRRPVAVVTGGNRGLGLETCRQLAARGVAVLLASRRPPEGADRDTALLVAQGLAVAWHPLDVADPGSIAAFAGALRDEKLVVDALVNNAGVFAKRLDAASARETVTVDFLGPLRVTDALAPLLAPAARVVMVSSGMGELAALPEPLRRRFDGARDRAALLALEEEFVAEAARGEHGADGALAYRVAKCGLNALTRLLAAELRGRGVLVNAVCPGWVRTDMGGPGAARDVATGAAGIVWAATLPPGAPTGGFFRDGKPIDW
jgi:NAD(P)-dependent dehydrogenase (short-subunit alcohol dehydrogenase family)